MTPPSLKTCPQSRRKLVCYGDFPEVFELLFASNALLIQLIEFETRRHKSLQSGKFGFLALVVKTMQLWGKSEIERLDK